MPDQPLIDRLFAEMKGRVKEEDASVPYKDGEWLYWTDFAKGTEYRRWWRKPASGGDDELLLDENALAEGHEYFRLGAFSVSKTAAISPTPPTPTGRSGSTPACA